MNQKSTAAFADDRATRFAPGRWIERRERIRTLQAQLRERRAAHDAAIAAARMALAETEAHAQHELEPMEGELRALLHEQDAHYEDLKRIERGRMYRGEIPFRHLS